MKLKQRIKSIAAAIMCASFFCAGSPNVNAVVYTDESISESYFQETGENNTYSIEVSERTVMPLSKETSAKSSGKTAVVTTTAVSTKSETISTTVIKDNRHEISISVMMPATSPTNTDTTTTSSVSGTNTSPQVSTSASPAISVDAAYYSVTLINAPDKLTYNIGEELDLTGLTVSLYLTSGILPEPKVIYDSVNPLDKPDSFIIDSSSFDNTKTGTYKILVCPRSGWANSPCELEVTVIGESQTTEPTNTTATTTNTSPQASVSASVSPITSASVAFSHDVGAINYYARLISAPDKLTYNVGEELDLTGLTVSLSYIINGVSTKETVIYSEVNPLDEPDDFYIITSSFDNTKPGTYKILVWPRSSGWVNRSCEFEVTVTGESQTTEPTNTTATTTNTSPQVSVSVSATERQGELVIIISIVNKPDKLEYKIGDEIDLTGLTVNAVSYMAANSDIWNYYELYSNVSPMDYPKDFIVDTSDFDSSKPGTYTIKVNGTGYLNACFMRKDASFEVTVTGESQTTEPTNTTATTTTISTEVSMIETSEAITTTETTETSQKDPNGDGKVDVRDAAFIARMLAQGKVSELPDTADYNGDGVVNVRDAAAIARDLAKKKE